jgi:hypothetical protein
MPHAALQAVNRTVSLFFVSRLPRAREGEGEGEGI